MKNQLKEKTWSKLETLARQGIENHVLIHHETKGLRVDFSHQNISKDILELLIEHANHCNLSTHIEDLFIGKKINISQNRPALHTALRTKDHTSLYVDDHDIMPDIIKTREDMRRISDLIRNQLWYGHTGKPIKNIVNIGVGGSDLGPKFCVQALQHISSHTLSYHFISDGSPNAFEKATQGLDAETTLFIVSSKSFTTPETLYNAKKAFALFGNHINWQQHFIAVTSNTTLAKSHGFKHILPIWDWVGGRFSLCSAINLITAIAIGFDQFEKLLSGANHMDQHFLKQPLDQNIPVIAAMIGIWNINFRHIHNHLILTYAQELNKFVPYIQQLDMESNGKSISIDGKKVSYATGPIVWGGPGNQAQHSYFQSLCQGTHRITADFITVESFKHEMINQMANHKMQTLTSGIGTIPTSFNFIEGKLPLNHFTLETISPFTIGQLVALFEHKVFVQSKIWNINPFDQPGVEAAKKHGVSEQPKKMPA